MTQTEAEERAKTVRGPYRNGVRRRREIIETASRVFASYGYTSGSLRQIAADVGVTPAALVRHFDSKDGLLAAVLENWDAESKARNTPDVEGLDYFVGLRDAVIRNQQNRGLIELFLTLAAESTNPDHPAHAFIQDRYDNVYASGVAHLSSARAVGDVLPMDDATLAAEVRSVFAMMDGLQLQWLIDPSTPLTPVFSIALDGYLQRWTGRSDVLPPLPDIRSDALLFGAGT